MSMHDCTHGSIHIDSLHCLSVMRRRRETKGGSLIEKWHFFVHKMTKEKIAKIDRQTYLRTSKSFENSWTINQKCRHVWDKYKVRKENCKRIIFCCKQWQQATYLCQSWWRIFCWSMALLWTGAGGLCFVVGLERPRPFQSVDGSLPGIPGLGPTYCLLCHARILDYVILVQMYQVPRTVPGRSYK